MSKSFPKKKEPVRWRRRRVQTAIKFTVIGLFSRRVVEDDSDGMAAA